MSTDSTDRVLIVGGGVAGLALARALHRRNVPALVLERRSGPADAGLAVNLPGNAIRALGELGLADALVQTGTAIRHRSYRTERDRTLFSIDEAAFWDAGAQPRCMRRADLLRLLRLGLPDGTVREDCGVFAIRQDETGVTVALTDGTSERGSLLAGADGVHSTVRRALFGEATLGAAVLARASWRFMAPNPGIDGWTLWSGRRGLFLLIPVEGEAYGWAALTGDAPAGSDLAAAASVFGSFPSPVRETLSWILARPDAIYHSPLEEVRIPSWTSGRTLLVGDAAHATAPVWAQGAAMALEDALVLARLLAEHPDRSTVGEAYERLRRPRVEHVQAMTDRVSRSARRPGWLQRRLLPIVGPKSYRATYEPLRRSVLEG
ncbi:FAD-dependent monooxygenase [Methylobacterium brachythecii]|uniref:2-polyprenyl-6-methoxyphenol hydroxylase-like FAD-dependent oxidoreductase n=1 Tax=Methylobacterium brachythecii TaxID=1176177 RepID=A0A7W6AHX4_9HYPH|nr:FAD-dependent monooxygenase [Methylobacterium brachythecii]MBB3902666.1 2-polyprenyl-6-methoxyphenol hydroxylase-like FAD-dependent oxidoreductase [Methylobacterium brachythecii]GLS42511.1 putative salicylate hydroxylase [Methylobacterium brachythecii]